MWPHLRHCFWFLYIYTRETTKNFIKPGLVWIYKWIAFVPLSKNAWANECMKNLKWRGLVWLRRQYSISSLSKGHRNKGQRKVNTPNGKFNFGCRLLMFDYIKTEKLSKILIDWVFSVMEKIIQVWVFILRSFSLSVILCCSRVITSMTKFSIIPNIDKFRISFKATRKNRFTINKRSPNQIVRLFYEKSVRSTNRTDQKN